MATTLLQLRDQLRDKAGIKNKVSYPDLMLTNDINLSQRDLQLKIRELWRNEASLNVAGGLASLTMGALSGKQIPFSTFTGLLEAPGAIFGITTSDGATYGYAQEISRHDFLERGSNSYGASLSNPVFCIQNEAVWLVPSTITTAVADYEKAFADLSADGDNVEFPDIYVPQLITITLQRMANTLEQQDKSIEAAKVRGQAIERTDESVSAPAIT